MMVSIEEFTNGMKGAFNMEKGPAPGENIIKVPSEKQNRCLEIMARNVPALPGQIFGRPKPRAKTEIKDGKLYLKLWNRGNIYGSRPAMVFYFRDGYLTYDLLLSKIFLPIEPARMQIINSMLSGLDDNL